MNIEQENVYLQIIDTDFDGMKNMLTHIQELICGLPVQQQLEFINPLKTIICDALFNANDLNQKS